MIGFASEQTSAFSDADYFSELRKRINVHMDGHEHARNRPEALFNPGRGARKNAESGGRVRGQSARYARKDRWHFQTCFKKAERKRLPTAAAIFA
jgi:hypothetical protein